MNDRVEVCDWWAFHDDGSVQFVQVTEGEVTDYRDYENAKDAPIFIIDERSWNRGFVGPIIPMTYHARLYYRPASTVSQKETVDDIKSPD